MRVKHFHTVRQKDSRQCGAAALAAVCCYYGKEYSLDFLSELTGTGCQGVSLHSLSEAARVLGFKTMNVKCPVDALGEAELPIILHWTGDHYVVLYDVKDKGSRYLICDPSRGCVKYSKDAFVDKWAKAGEDGRLEGIALLLEVTDRFGQIDEPERGKTALFNVVWEYFRKYRHYFAIIVAGLMLGCVLQLAMPLLTQSVVDIGIQNRSIGFIWLVLLGELFVVAGRTATDMIRNWLVLHISMRVNLGMLSDFFIKLLRLPIGFFDSKRLGDLMQRMSDHKRVQVFMTTQLLSILFSVLTFVAFAIVLFVYSHLIFGIFMLGSLVYGGWICLFLMKRKALDYEKFEREADNQNVTVQFLGSVRDIKLYDCQRRRRWEWEEVQTKLFDVELKSLKLQQTQDSGAVLINEVKNILITVFAAAAVIEGNITLGTMLAIQYVCGQLNSPLAEMMHFVFSLQGMVISLERINEIHQLDDERKAPAPSNVIEGGDIVFHDIVFRYDRYAQKNVIDHVNFTVPYGKTVAIVGESGSGKSTLLKLLLGFYPLQNGEITIGGRAVSKCDIKKWRDRCGVVLQDGIIFAESIERNIAVDDGDVDRVRLVNAARMACIDAYVNSLPSGYKTIIGQDGHGLSLGQKQRILLARAMYKNPDYIILDEATNSLDARNEKAIVENLENFYSGKTAIIVAHRLSTVRNADLIVVLEDGRIVESGSHEILIKNQGAYYHLVQNQLNLGKE